MSFGWSAGDIAQAVSIIVDIVKALDDASGAAYEYREAVLFLTDLKRTLEPLRAAVEIEITPTYQGEINDQVLAIREPIERFLKKHEKLKGKLGEQKSESVFSKLRNSKSKLTWKYSISEEAARLEKKIKRHMIIVDRLLQRLILDSVLSLQDNLPKKLHVVFTEVLDLRLVSALRESLLPVEQNQQRLLTQNENAHVYTKFSDYLSSEGLDLDEALSIIKSHLRSKKVTQRSIEAAIEQKRLEQGVSGDSENLLPSQKKLEHKRRHTPRDSKLTISSRVNPSSKDVLDAQLKNVFSLVALYLGQFIGCLFLGFVEASKSSSANGLNSLVRKDITFTDAIGRQKSLPYELVRDYEVFISIVKVNFVESPGSFWVKRGEYEFLLGKDKDPITAPKWHKSISPGSYVYMTIIVQMSDWHFDMKRCLAPSCDGDLCIYCPNWVQCSVCEKEVYFTGDSARIPKFEPPLVVERGALPSPQNAKTESTRENGTIAKNNLDNHVPEPALARQSAVPPSEHYNLAEIRHFDRVSTIGLFEDFISRKPPAPVDIQNERERFEIPEVHWLSRVFDNRYPVTCLKYGEPAHVVEGLTSSTEISRLGHVPGRTLLQQQFYLGKPPGSDGPVEPERQNMWLSFNEDAIQKYIFVICVKPGTTHANFALFDRPKFCIHELCIESKEANIQLRCWENDASAIWMTLPFDILEEMILFHSSFVALKCRSPHTIQLSPKDYIMTGHRKLFQGKIIDDEFQHSLCVMEEEKTGVLYLIARAASGELRKCPIWLAFVTHVSTSAKWIFRNSRHTVRLRELHQYKFCDEYGRNERPRAAAIELYFEKAKAASAFCGLFEEPESDNETKYVDEEEDTDDEPRAAGNSTTSLREDRAGSVQYAHHTRRDAFSYPTTGNGERTAMFI